MSDGLSDANETERKIIKVEWAAYDLNDALLETGDLMFFKVHPQAVDIANEHLKECGYKLIKVGK